MVARQEDADRAMASLLRDEEIEKVAVAMRKAKKANKRSK
jgi:hypothetical protein